MYLDEPAASIDNLVPIIGRLQGEGMSWKSLTGSELARNVEYEMLDKRWYNLFVTYIMSIWTIVSSMGTSTNNSRRERLYC